MAHLRRLALIAASLAVLVAASFPDAPAASDGAERSPHLRSLRGGWVQIPLDSGRKTTQTFVSSMIQGAPGLLVVGAERSSTAPGTEVMWFSRDGRSWQRVAHPPDTTAPGVPSGPIAATKQGFVALGAGTTGTWASNDGLTWRQVSSGTGVGEGMGIHALTAGGPGLVAVGGGLPGRPGYVLQSKTRAAVWISSDGSSWTRLKYDKATFGGAEMFGVTNGGPGLVAVGRTYPAENGEHAVVWTSSDGHVWRRQSEGQFGNGNGMYRVLKGSEKLLAIGEAEGPNPYVGSLAWTSTDGITWKQIPGDAFGQGLVSDLTAAGAGFLAVGQQDGDRVLWYSPDGMTWEKEADGEIFRGDSTTVTGVALVRDSIVVVGTVQQHDKPGSMATAWVWSPTNPQGPLSPVPGAALDPRALRLRLSDLPPGYHPEQQAYLDLCDLEGHPDLGGRCAALLRALGRYSAYWTEYTNLGHEVPGPLFVDGAVIVAQSAPGAKAAMRVADVLVNPDVSNLRVKRIPNGVQIGQETRRYATWSLSVGQRMRAYAVVWRDGRVMGAVVTGGVPRAGALREAELYATILHGHLRSGSLSSGPELTTHSQPAELGKAYPFQLYTHCGVEYAVDFDGAFWDLADPAWQSRSGNPPSGIGNPYQGGTMTLLDPDHARFAFSGGSIAFIRHIGPKLVPGPCS